jgi:hypothetical protein
MVALNRLLIIPRIEVDYHDLVPLRRELGD